MKDGKANGRFAQGGKHVSFWEQGFAIIILHWMLEQHIRQTSCSMEDYLPQSICIQSQALKGGFTKSSLGQ